MQKDIHGKLIANRVLIQPRLNFGQPFILLAFVVFLTHVD